jgi:hypothetical protein
MVGHADLLQKNNLENLPFRANQWERGLNKIIIFHQRKELGGFLLWRYSSSSSLKNYRIS